MNTWAIRRRNGGIDGNDLLLDETAVRSKDWIPVVELEVAEAMIELAAAPPPKPAIDRVWRPRATVRWQHTRDDGKHVLGFGGRIGYWPCLRAPFVRIDAGPFIVEVWCGWGSYGGTPRA